MARIFIAIRFKEEFRQSLVSLQETLRARGVHGDFCPSGNLHMTLAFIGEDYDMNAIRKAVSEVVVKPFDLALDRLGSFPTKSGVIWCGLKNNAPVCRLSEQIRERLTDYGVSYKNGVFFPHISLVQHPSAIVTDIDVPVASMRERRSI